MIPSYEQMGDWLEEIVQQFPAPFFAALDGGVQLEEQALPDPDFPHGQMYSLGEYCHDLLGRYIVLYYGSFAALFPDGDEETWKDEIFATVPADILWCSIIAGPTESPISRSSPSPCATTRAWRMFRLRTQKRLPLQTWRSAA